MNIVSMKDVPKKPRISPLFTGKDVTDELNRYAEKTPHQHSLHSCRWGSAQRADSFRYMVDSDI